MRFLGKPFGFIGVEKTLVSWRAQQNKPPSLIHTEEANWDIQNSQQTKIIQLQMIHLHFLFIWNTISTIRIQIFQDQTNKTSEK